MNINSLKFIFFVHICICLFYHHLLPPRTHFTIPLTDSRDRFSLLSQSFTAALSVSDTVLLLTNLAEKSFRFYTKVRFAQQVLINLTPVLSSFFMSELKYEDEI